MRCFFIGLALVSAAPVAAKAPLPPVVVTGPPVSCVLARSIRNTRVVDDRTIDFELNGRKIYRNTLPASCPQLGFQRTFAYELSNPQLCSVDIITVIIQGAGAIPGARCGLGKFTPIAAPNRN